MFYLLNMTATEWGWRVCFWIVIVGVVLSVIGGVIEEIVLRHERKKEKQRRACRRYGVPIRPTRRY